jgi:hypothetical protein
MSAQKDMVAGLDASPLDGLSQEQIMQMINGLEPLSNIGFVFVGTARPDITNNPRMIRYFWLDISDASNPVLKRYIGDRNVVQDNDASWSASGVSTNSILTSMIAQRSTTGGVDITRMKLNSDYSASPASAFFIMRVAANGKDIEVVNFNIAFSDAGGIALGSITQSGSGPSKYLGIDASLLTYKYINPATDFTASFNNQIPLESAVLPSTARFVPRTNAGGTAVEWITPIDIYNNNEFPLSKMSGGGAVANDILRWDGTTWGKATPSIILTAGDTQNNGVVSGQDLATSAIHTFAGFGVGIRPAIIRAGIICGTVDGLFEIGDIIELAGITDETGDHESAATVIFNVLTGDISIVFESISSVISTISKAGGARVNLTRARWFPIVYLWRAG